MIFNKLKVDYKSKIIDTSDEDEDNDNKKMNIDIKE